MCYSPTLPASPEQIIQIVTRVKAEIIALGYIDIRKDSEKAIEHHDSAKAMLIQGCKDLYALKYSSKVLRPNRLETYSYPLQTDDFTWKLRGKTKKKAGPCYSSRQNQT
jgi:hypothetical protein